MVQEIGGLDFGRTLVRTATPAALDAEKLDAFLRAQGHPAVDGDVGALAGYGLLRADGARDG